MCAKFNPKIYLNKDRIYRMVKGQCGISKIMIWDKINLSYIESATGAKYEASKYVVLPNKRRKRIKSLFKTLDEARNWQSGKEEDLDQYKSSLLFETLVEDWAVRSLKNCKIGTQVRYRTILKNHFNFFNPLQIHQIDAKLIDNWIDELFKSYEQVKEPRRIHFKPELDLLSTILRFYSEHYDDPSFVIPIKKRHRQRVRRRLKETEHHCELSNEEFHLFKLSLLEGTHGSIISDVAIIQFAQALRISEVPAIKWSDVYLDPISPANSRLYVKRSVKWDRNSNSPRVELGFKNSKAVGGVKELPLLPMAYEVIKRRFDSREAGAEFIFFSSDSEIFSYRTFQHAYNSAFKKAGLNKRTTHILRHAGCRAVYNQFPDTAIAQQLLGNSTLQSTLVYAKRDKRALTQASEEIWKKRDIT